MSETRSRQVQSLARSNARCKLCLLYGWGGLRLAL